MVLLAVVGLRLISNEISHPAIHGLARREILVVEVNETDAPLQADSYVSL